MKKLLLTMLGVVGMLCSTSCSDEEIVSSVEGEAMVQFTVELEGADASRADAYKISDGTTVNTVYYEVFSNITKNGVVTQTEIETLKGKASISGKKATVNLALVKGQTYDIVFWASKEGVYNTSDLTNIAVNEGTANDETKDAFTAKKTYTVNGPIKETITLFRPFAQINFGTLLTDMQAAEAAGAELTESKIKVSNVADYYNALSEEGCIVGEEPQTVEFGYKAIPNRNEQELTFGEGVTPTYEYLATAYVLFPGKATDQVTTDLTMTVPTELNQEVVLTVPTAPAQRNFRTNILGNLLTNTADFNIVVDPIYNTPDNNIDIWDGKSVKKPAYDEDTKTYSVGTAEELAWIANLVNGTLPADARSEFAKAENLSGQIVKLTADINLAGQEWTPIGTEENNFEGNFEGNNKVIKNLTITEHANTSDGYAYAGLFGVTAGAENNFNYIKNLVIENVNISTTGNIVAATVAYPYYTTIENVTIKGNINIKGGDYTSGVLAYTRRCVEAKNLTINGNEGSVIEGRQAVGGIISDIQMNGGLTANYSNFTATGLTIKGVKNVGGISGIISQQSLDGATVKNVNIVCDDTRKGIVSGSTGGKSTIINVSYENVTGATRIIGATYEEGYYIGQIVEVAGAKAVIYSIENGVKAVSVAELNLKNKKWQDAMNWAAGFGEGWYLASMEDLNAIYDLRCELNDVLEADNAENALFWEGDELYIKNGSIYYACYLSSTEAPAGEVAPDGNTYFENRVFFKLFNDRGYSDVLYSSFDCINKGAPLRDNYFARAIIEL